MTPVAPGRTVRRSILGAALAAALIASPTTDGGKPGYPDHVTPTNGLPVDLSVQSFSFTP